MLPFHLIRHGDAICPAVTRIDGYVELAKDGSLRLIYTLTGNLAALRIPTAGHDRSTDGLWRHTCFEVFIMAGSGPAYREFNFSPSGDWANYSFRSYRESTAPGASSKPNITIKIDAHQLRLLVTLTPACLPTNDTLRAGISAVVEDADGGLSYWALRHPPGKPDFHHTDAFALTLTRL